MGLLLDSHLFQCHMTFFCRHTVSIWRSSISQIEEFVGRHDDTQLLPHHPIHDRGSWHHRHHVTDDMFVSCMACRHQWGTVGKYRLYSPLGSQRIKKRNYEEYKKYKKEDERGRLCCIDPAEQSRDALGTLLAGTVVFLEKIKFQAFQVSIYWDHQTGDASVWEKMQKEA